MTLLKDILVSDGLSKPPLVCRLQIWKEVSISFVVYDYDLPLGNRKGSQIGSTNMLYFASKNLTKGGKHMVLSSMLG